VILLNSRSGQEHDAPRHNYPSKYGKLAYSTHFPFNVIPVQGSYAPDASISLTCDGQEFGHRLHTRSGEVAPGFSWSRFDEVVHDELQPLWVAILMWKDVQIRLTVIRPTLPIRAFEAPGSLGCEKAVAVLRRSDPSAGWEYAEVEGRAIGIQRLMGYDAQRASAPFLDQSNINLAHAYSEQPVIYESQPSVSARCLAAASLVRPAPFEPAHEFSGIKVEIEHPEIFRMTLPDGSSALVALGETIPKHVTVNGFDAEGSRIRFFQISMDSSEISGLGLTHISGLATFYEPATFRLRRISNSTIHVRTNTGMSLTDQWVRGDARCIEVLTLDHQWVDVTHYCQRGAIPTQVVQEWSDRNQRTLVDFRIDI
jgi:hypothetical protein